MMREPGKNNKKTKKSKVGYNTRISCKVVYIDPVEIGFVTQSDNTKNMCHFFQTILFTKKFIFRHIATKRSQGMENVIVILYLMI